MIGDYKEIECPLNHYQLQEKELCNNCELNRCIFDIHDMNDRHDYLENCFFVMVNRDGKYWCKNRNTKNYRNAVIDSYYNFYERLWSMYNEGGQYDYQKWNAIGIIPYKTMIEAEKLRKKSEEDYSRYLNNFIGIYFVNLDHYDMKLVESDDPNENRIKMIWNDERVSKYI